MTASDCSASGGSFLGDDSNCQGNPCDDGVWNVPEDFATIQEAIDAASDGYTIAIAAGTYPINSSINANGKEITIRGATNSDGSPSVIIDGQHSTRVIYSDGDSSNTVFENLIIENGAAGVGGGMYLLSSDPTITNCTFYNNFSSDAGGGVYIDGSSGPLFSNCSFVENGANNQAGGVFISSSGSTLTDCLFDQNHSGWGGGLWCGGAALITNCLFTNNVSTDVGGGGMYILYADPVLTNCIFTGNVAQNNGGAIYCTDDSSPLINDCRISSNSASVGDRGGIYSTDGSSPNLSDTEVCDNTPDQIYGLWDNNGGNTIADECPVDCDADITGDGFVNINDLLTLIANWNTSSPLGDVNEDGIVDVADLLLLIAAWGACP